nr:glycosyltransferase family 4 protein [Sphingomicrobium aestuariivivum]
METVNDRGWKGALRRVGYSWLARKIRGRAETILAIGDRTSDWLVARGFPETIVHPFAYFLPEADDFTADRAADRRFRVGFVGQLIERKRVDLLIDASSALDVDVDIVGAGSLKARLEDRAAASDHIRLLGKRPMDQVRTIIAEFDVLVLPSEHDGWGAVVSEALLAGTRVIVSDACGSCVAARHDEGSAVFPAGDLAALRAAIKASKAQGKVDAKERAARASRSRYLGAMAGAARLEAILQGAIPHDFPLTKAVP